MKEQTLTISAVKELQKKIFLMRLSGNCREISAPGQFINIKIHGFFLRRPISIQDYCEDELSIVFKIVGLGTEKLSKMQVGSRINVLMPLGNGFDLSVFGNSFCKERPTGLGSTDSEPAKSPSAGSRPAELAPRRLASADPIPTGTNLTPILIGGGIGLPPLYGLAKKLKGKGITPTVIAGFNSASEVILEKDFLNLDIATVVTTVDGSYGKKGLVTDALKDISASVPESYVCACGPEPMLKAVHALSGDGQFSFEARMACGFGACMGCSRKTNTGYKRICSEGPVLYGKEIVW